MESFIIDDGVKQVGFSGKLLKMVTTNPDGNRHRWTELRLWRIAAGHQQPHDDPTGDYLLQSYGMTDIYHRHAGGCRKGGPKTLGEMTPGRRVPCPVCWPVPPVLTDDDMVRAETDWPQAWQCETPADLYAVLRELSSKGRTARSLSGLSRPAEDLLVGAAKEDAPILAHLRGVRWLTT